MATVLVIVLLGAMPDTGMAVGLGQPFDAGFELRPETGAAAAEVEAIVVDVSGAVLRPGLHRVPAGNRVGDAIEAAGGFAPRADLAATSQSLNLARPLADGDKVLVPELGTEAAAGRGASDGRIDLNGAGQAELETLPGIGPVTARKIIEARKERRFAQIRDLRTRGLVSESVLDGLKGLVRAG